MPDSRPNSLGIFPFNELSESSRYAISARPMNSVGILPDNTFDERSRPGMLRVDGIVPENKFCRASKFCSPGSPISSGSWPVMKLKSIAMTAREGRSPISLGTVDESRLLLTSTVYSPVHLPISVGRAPDNKFPASEIWLKKRLKRKRGPTRASPISDGIEPVRELFPRSRVLFVAVSFAS